MKRKPKPKPRRLFKRASLPELLATANELRNVRKVIVPWQIYQLRYPDGQLMLQCTGADLIRDADNFVSLVDAEQTGNEAEIRRAILRITDDCSD